MSLADDTETKKSFWAHIADLRKAFMRSAMAIGLALVICLLGVKYLVLVLQYPLQEMDLMDRLVAAIPASLKHEGMTAKPKPTVTFQVGGERIGPYTVTREQFPLLPPGDSPHALYEVSSMQVGTEQVPVLKLIPSDPAITKAEAVKVKLHNYSPAEGFMVAFHVALYGALILASPVWIYQIFSFLMPALNKKERRMILPWMGWGVFLFLLGVLGTYFLLLPIALRASMEYSELLGFEGTQWRADDYISFTTRFIFGMGLGFQFPLVVLFFVKLGFLNYKQLAKYRRHVFLGAFVLGAVLTTPEVITQVAMAVPLYILYEICIIIAWFWDRKKRKNGEIIEV